MSNSLWPHGLYVACQASLSFIISWSLLRLISIESVMPSTHLICHLLLLLPLIFPSIGVYFNELALQTRWPAYWSFSFYIIPSNEYSGLISFRTDGFDLFAVQRSLESSLAPQFESISSLALSLLYCPTLTSAHDYRFQTAMGHFLCPVLSCGLAWPGH